MRTTTCLISCLLLAPSFIVRAADPKTAVFWSTAQLKEVDKKLPPKINPELHLATERLMDSAFILHRDGPSTAEIHDDQADFIVIREGEGALLIGTQGTKLIEGKRTAPGEQRGTAVEGGTKYPVTAGDMIYVPANTPHQFLVDPGKHFTAVIVKVTPK
jgi:mannose-6-phosphate isomerase-like protein (cupin superfamily)